MKILKGVGNMNKSSEELMDDLLLVGRTKSLGYLPLSTLVDICNSSVEEMKEFAIGNGLSVIVFESGECSVGSGALYMYHDQQLREQLKMYKGVFNDAGVSVDTSESYINHISNETVSPRVYPNAYVSVGKTFNDCRFVDINPLKVKSEQIGFI